MPLNAILTNVQGHDFNLVRSIRQYLTQAVKASYDTEATALGLNQGMTVTLNGQQQADTLGLGVIDARFDDPSLTKRVPSVSFRLDDGRATKDVKAIGMGDGANWEWRSVKLTCVPAVTVSNDAGKTLEADARSFYVLQTHVRNAFQRTFTMPIVDGFATPDTNGLYPQIGIAYIENVQFSDRPSYKDYLIVDRRDFEVLFTLKLAIATADGL